MRETGQKTVLDYFNLRSSKIEDLENSSLNVDGDLLFPRIVKKSRQDEKADLESTLDRVNSTVSNVIVVIESDNEENEEDLFLNRKVRIRPVINFKLDSRKNQRKSSSKRKTSVNNDNVHSSEKWSCAQCTFLNHPLLKFCEICSATKKHNSSRMHKECSIVEDLNKSDNSSIGDMSVELDQYERCDQNGTSQNGTSPVYTDENDSAGGSRHSLCFISNIDTSTPARESMNRTLMPLDNLGNTSFTDCALVSDPSIVMNVSVVNEIENFDLCGDWNLTSNDNSGQSVPGEEVESHVCESSLSGMNMKLYLAYM